MFNATRSETLPVTERSLKDSTFRLLLNGQCQIALAGGRAFYRYLLFQPSALLNVS